jgi:hypothetical protein
MTKERALIYYKASLSIYIKWLDDGLITEHDFIRIEEIIADKYGLPLGSIYRRKT